MKKDWNIALKTYAKSGKSISKSSDKGKFHPNEEDENHFAYNARNYKKISKYIKEHNKRDRGERNRRPSSSAPHDREKEERAKMLRNFALCVVNRDTLLKILDMLVD